MPFKRILLAIDRTARANDVFAVGLDIAQKYNAELTLLHCIVEQNATFADSRAYSSGAAYSWPRSMVPTTDTSNTALVVDGAEQTELQVAQELLHLFQQKAEATGVSHVSVEVRSGPAGDRICETAKDVQADLIIVGHSGIEEFLLCSVSNHVVHHAPCAVLLIP